MVKGPETTSDVRQNPMTNMMNENSRTTIPNIAKQKALLLFQAVRFCLGQIC